MSVPKHTPGPWKVVIEETGGRPGNDPRVWKTRKVTRVYGAGVQICNASQANARLIAAAPEMLHLLKVTRNRETVTTSAFYAKLDFIIKQVEGDEE